MLTGPRPAAALALAGALLALAAVGPAAATAVPGPAAATARGPASAATGPAGAAGGYQARADDLASLAAIGVPAAWRQTTGHGVTVAVLDTGTDPAVPDLSGSVRNGPDLASGANPAGFRPSRWHGTFIASLIAGHGSGPGRVGGIVGVAPAARILAVRVILDADEPGFPVYNANAHYEQAIAGGIRYAVRHGAGVINMSFGSATGASQVRRAIGYAVSHDVVVVASAGNDGTEPGRPAPFSYPASFTGVISVAAVGAGPGGAGGRPAPFSSRNASVVISAPGVDITGAAPVRGYLTVNGTSPASAFVAGVAALIRSRYPRLGPALVRQALVESARYRPARGYSRGVGFGEVDAAAALEAAGRLAARPPVTGLAPAAHFGARPLPGPVRVIPGDLAGIAAARRIEAAGSLGFITGLLILAMIIGRGRRPRTARPGDAAHPGDPVRSG